MSHILNTPRTYQLHQIHPSLEIQIETNRSVVDTDSTHADSFPGFKKVAASTDCKAAA